MENPENFKRKRNTVFGRDARQPFSQRDVYKRKKKFRTCRIGPGKSITSSKCSILHHFPPIAGVDLRWNQWRRSNDNGQRRTKSLKEQIIEWNRKENCFYFPAPKVFRLFNGFSVILWPGKSATGKSVEQKKNYPTCKSVWWKVKSPDCVRIRWISLTE